MTNNIVLEKTVGSYKQPDTGQTVEVYNYHASDAAGNPPNGTKIGDATEITGTGVYQIGMSESTKVTVVVGGAARAGLVGVLLNGEKALDDSVDTSAIEDSAVTPGKTTFTDDF